MKIEFSIFSFIRYYCTQEKHYFIESRTIVVQTEFNRYTNIRGMKSQRNSTFSHDSQRRKFAHAYDKNEKQ